jgi:hypothetical protein
MRCQDDEMNYDNRFKYALAAIAVLGLILGAVASGIATWQLNQAIQGLLDIQAANIASAWQTIGNGLVALGAVSGIAYLVVAAIGYDLYFRSPDRIADEKAAAKKS